MKHYTILATGILAASLFAGQQIMAQQAAAPQGAPILALTLAPAKGDAKLRVTSSAFKAGGSLPEQYTQNGKNVSPPVSWSKGPKETQSYVLIAEDAGGNRPDPTIHWVAYDIPANLTGLPEAVPTEAKLANGTLQGVNVRKAAGFLGPKPPMGVSHPYHFEVFALDAKLGLDPASTDRKALVTAMAGHVLASGETVANYMTPQPPFDPKDFSGVWLQVPPAPAYAKLIPYNAKFAAILKEHQDNIAAGRPYRHDVGACLPRGLPGVLTTAVYPIEFLQGDNEIALIKETPGSMLRIFMNRGHKSKDEVAPSYFGDNIGHWEGNVLVVDSTNLGKVDTLDAQSPTSGTSLHLVSRLQRVTYDTLNGDITLEDPEAWTGPITVKVVFKLHKDWELQEAICDNERDMVDASGNPFVKGAAKN